jgi:type II secretory pathway pseudopilin PulG
MNFQRQKSLRSSRGFLSIEAMVVLVVVIGLLGLAASKMGMLGSNAGVVEEISNIQTLYTLTKQTKGSSGYGAAGANLVTTLNTTGSLPTNMTVSGGVLYNAYGGAVTIVSTGQGFTITDSGLPAQDCATLSSKLSRSGTFATTKINSNTTVSGEVVQSTAATQCNTTGNSIALTSNS